MDLRNGCGGQRRRFEGAEDLAERLAEGFLDHGDGDCAGEGRHPILQFRQFIGDVDRQQIAPRRQRLAEFHENRAQLLERQAQPLAARAADAALEPGPRREIEEIAQRPVQMGGAHEIIEPVPDQRPLDLQQPGEHPQLHQRALARCSSRVRRASIRSSCPAQPSTPRRELLHFGLVDQIAAFLLQVLGDVLAGSAACAARPSPHALASRDRCRAGMSPIQRDSSSSRSGRAAANKSRYRLAISASPRICTADSRLPPGVAPLNICSSAGADPEIIASAGESSPASSAARPPQQWCERA